VTLECLIPGAGGTATAEEAIGKGALRNLILTGGMIGAQEAYRISLVPATSFPPPS